MLKRTVLAAAILFASTSMPAYAHHRGDCLGLHRVTTGVVRTVDRVGARMMRASNRLWRMVWCDRRHRV